jgi:threonine dehydrogenase-like Zn-dependent dehydrogenase
VHAVARGQVREGDSVVVMGAGPIGLMTVIAARARGARVTVAEPAAARRDLGRAVGADGVIDPASSTAGVVAELLKLTGGGADVVFDTPQRHLQLGDRLLHRNVSLVLAVAVSRVLGRRNGSRSI